VVLIMRPYYLFHVVIWLISVVRLAFGVPVLLIRGFLYPYCSFFLLFILFFAV
jgi:uncharacterized membrane protein YphA (DoxX/SURF4 family)